MVTAKDVQGVMAMMPSFSTKDAGDLTAKNTIDVDNLKAGVDKMINDGIDVITTTGSFGECYNLSWDEYKTLAAAAVDAVKKRVPLFVGATSPNVREVVERLKFVQDIGADGTLLGVPYYDAQSPEYMADLYTQIAEMFPKLGVSDLSQSGQPQSQNSGLGISALGEMSEHHRHERQPSRHPRVYPVDGNHPRQDQRHDQSGADGSLLSHGLGGLLVDRFLDGAVAGAASEKSSARGKRSGSGCSDQRNHGRRRRRAARRQRRRHGEAAHRIRRLRQPGAGAHADH